MKKQTAITAGLLLVLLGGCVHSNTDFVSTFEENEIRTPQPVMGEHYFDAALDTLEKSCDQGKSEKLQAADSVMKKIVELGLDNHGHKLKDANPELIRAGNTLYKLTMEFYNNNTDPAYCRTQVNVIGRYLDLVHPNFSSKN